MIQSTYMKTLMGVLIALGIFSCSNGTNPMEEQAIQDAKEIFSELPELKEEIDEHKEKVNAQEITGTFSGSIDGEPFEFTTWEAQKSRITFLDFKGLINAAINGKPMESLRIEFFANNWYNKQFPVDVAPSLETSDNNEFVKVRYAKENEKGDIIQEFQTADGVLTVNEFSSDHVKISFEGEGFNGDYRNQEKVPLTFEIDLHYNFVSSDARSSVQTASN